MFENSDVVIVLTPTAVAYTYIGLVYMEFMGLHEPMPQAQSCDYFYDISSLYQKSVVAVVSNKNVCFCELNYVIKMILNVC